MIKSARIYFLLLALLTSVAAICAAQSWDDSGWGDNNNRGWGDDNVNGNSVADNDESWGSPASAEMTSSEESVFPSSNSESSSTLIDEASSSQYDQAIVSNAPVMAFGGGGSSQNIFWIVSRDGRQHWRSVSIPCHRYARLLIIPSASGQLTMQERYPDGQVQTYNYGYVRAHNQYRFWFFADTSGTHRLRYRIDNGPYSDILTFHVGRCGFEDGADNDTAEVCPCCGRPL